MIGTFINFGIAAGSILTRLFHSSKHSINKYTLNRHNIRSAHADYNSTPVRDTNSWPYTRR